MSETPLASDTGIRNNDICQQIPGQIECFTRGHAGNNACRIREKRGGRCMTDTASGQVAVNFVRYHSDVIGQANFNNPLKFIRPPDSSGRDQGSGGGRISVTTPPALTLHTAAITLWNTVYIERTIEPLKQKGVPVNELLVSHPSPLLYKI
ncbi:TPA: hypothetical protein I4G51_24930 [Enterobacter asburiae]|nr:hypothetical protein [Enterobacter asburiae]HAS1802359.1 hypothetical protein [Enterobacter asburiae]